MKIITNNKLEKTNNKPESKPLVTIAIITYNSSKYVIETLESAKTQTYKNIELIISDDCSTDNTVEICKKWLLKNKNRFISAKIITTKKNTGIPKNCNRGLFAAKGEWIKIIAGDDALFTTCISDNIKFIKSNSKIKFCFSNMAFYENDLRKKNLIKQNIDYRELATLFSSLNHKSQLEVLARFSMIYAPTVFFNREKIFSVNGFDETYPFMEDWPTWYNWSSSGIRFFYFDSITVKYRLHNNSVSLKKDKDFILPNFIFLVNDFIINKLFIHYTKKEKLFYKFRYLYFKFYKNKKSNNILFKAFRRVWYYLVLLSFINKVKYVKRIYKANKTQIEC